MSQFIKKIKSPFRRMVNAIFRPYQILVQDEFNRTNSFLREQLEENLEHTTIKAIDHSLRNLFAPMIGGLVAYEFKNLNIALKRLEDQTKPQFLGQSAWDKYTSQSIILDTMYKLKPFYLIGRQLKKIKIVDSSYFYIESNQPLSVVGISQNDVIAIQNSSLIERTQCLDFSYAERQLLNLLNSENKNKEYILFIKTPMDLRFFLGAITHVRESPQIIWDIECLENLHDPVYLFRINQVLDELLKYFSIVSIVAGNQEGWVSIGNVPIPRRIKLVLANRATFDFSSEENISEKYNSAEGLDEGIAPPMYFDPRWYGS